MPPVEIKNLLVLDLFLDDQHGAHLEDHVAESVREVHVVRQNVDASSFRSTLVRKDHGEHEQEDKEDEEDNPMMGWHAIRRGLDEPRIVKAEFEAIQRLHDEVLKNIGIMLPFAIRLREVRYSD